MEQYYSSGLSGSAFCKQKNIPLSGFFYQLKKHKAPTKAKNSFLPVGTQPMIEVETKSGAIVRIPTSVSSDELRAILGAIQ